MARWLTFDRTGRLVTASYDGVVRLYAADKYTAPIAKFEQKGLQPFSVAFSPDGSRVAVGYNNSPDVFVLSGSDLSQIFKANATSVPKDTSMGAVAWSQDGSFLYAGGTWGGDRRLVRRWSKGGRGPFIDIPASSQRIVDLVGLKSGSMLIGGTEDFGLIDVHAKVTQLQGFGSLGLQSGGGHRLLISKDGSIVQIDAWHPKHTYRFAIADRLVKIDPSQDDTLASPIEKGSGLNITNWLDSTTPAVNGTPIKLRATERALSVAVVPGTQRFVLGGDFRLRLLDQLGHEVWALATPGSAWHVNVTNDQRLIVAAYGNGTIRWHRLSDGTELLALFIHPDGQRWIAWTPQGYYDASLGADD
jgi:WD40 repeat protein